MAVGIRGAVLAETPMARCSPATLHGTYVFAAIGFMIPASGPQPKAIVEIIRFNGDGTVGVTGGTRSVNGTVIREVPGVTGTYTVADLIPPGGACAGRLTFATGPSFDFFGGSTGEEVWMIQNNPDNVFQGKATEVAP